MPRFFQNVLGANCRTRDQEGIELVDIDAAKIEALRGIREVLSVKVGVGRLLTEADLGRVTEITDEGGHVVASISWADAMRGALLRK